METDHSHRNPEPEAVHPEEKPLQPFYTEPADGSDKQKYRLLFEDADEGIVVLQNEKFCFTNKKIASQKELKARDTLVNALDNWALLIDLDGRIQTINPAAAETLGQHPQDLVGLNIFSAMPSGTAIFQKTQVKKAARLKKPVDFQANFKGQYYEIRMNPVMPKAGKVSSMAIFARDVTEQIQHDRNMLESHTKLKCKFVAQTKGLKIKTRSLEESDIALGVLLKKRDEDKLNLEQRIMNSVKDLVLPYVNKLDHRITDDKCKTYLGILESNLKSILSPFSQRLSSIYMLLTPSEIEVAEYIKYGKSSKEIAKMLNLSVKTIETYRAQIRKKTGLRNKKANLRTYLLSFKSI